MKARIKAAGVSAFIVLALVAILGCDEDPAKSVKIIARPMTEAEAKPATAAQISAWHPAGCPRRNEFKTGASRVKISGPCALDFKPELVCHAAGDDFYASLQTKGKDESTFAININVEKYTGPGEYDEAEMSIWVREGTKMYRWDRWSADKISAVVGPDEKFVEIKSARLQGEPIMSACSRIPGHSINFKYDCGEIPESPTAIESSYEVVSGTFRCVSGTPANNGQ